MINIFLYPDSLLEYQKEKGKEIIIGNYFNVNNIKFDDIYSLKKKDYTVNFIDMYYKNTSILLQLPKSILHSVENSVLVIKFNETEKFKEFFIDPLEKYIQNNVHINSEKWFGKKFTMNKINNCFTSPYNNGKLNLSIESETVFFNKYKKMIYINDMLSIVKKNDSVDIVCLIKIANLQFIQNKFSYDLILEQAKVLVEESLVEYSIIDTDSIESLSSTDRENEYYTQSNIKEIDSIDQNFF